MKRNLLTFCLFLLFSTLFFSQSTPVVAVEYQALVDFYNSAGGSKWHRKWDINNNDIHTGAWVGVKAENGHIVEITLRNNNYQGTFPSTFSNLRFLKKLDIGGYYYNYNDFSAANLDNLSGLESLEYLDLSYSHIKSGFPVSWGKLTNLNTLILHHNEISGALPGEFGELRNLENIHFESNKIVSLPSTIGNLTKLINANFSFNQLGVVNKEFEKITTLKNLQLNHNNIANFQAILPTTVALSLSNQTVYHENFIYKGDDVTLHGLPQITKYSRTRNDFSELNNFRVYLRGSQMSGDIKMNTDGSITIPKTYISSIRKGDEIYLYQTNGSAAGTKVLFKNLMIEQPPVPDSEYQALVDFYNSAGGATWNQKWDTSSNNLNEGAWYGVSVENGHIVGLNLYNNNIRGTIPSSFSNLKHLRNLNLSGHYYSYHNLSNTDWNNIAGLESLESLNISYANITGSLPESWGNLTQLKDINVSYNKINGLFSTIGNLKALTSLNAASNQITGIPTNIGYAAKLESIDLSTNKIISVVKALENLSSLKTLSLHNNEITSVEARLPATVSLSIYSQANYIENFEYKGTDYTVVGLSEVTKYNRAKNDLSERNNFRLYLRDSDVGADFKMTAEGELVIPKQYLLFLKKGDKLYFVQNSGTAYNTRIYFKNVLVNQQPIPQEEYQALVDLYNAAGGARWNQKWDVTSNNLHEGSWYGVSVENGHVVELNLYNNNLRGTIPVTFGNLKYLRRIVFAGHYYNYHDLSTADLNNFAGLENLEHLDLAYCHIKQQIPDSWSQLKKLKVLSFYENDIAGAVPDVLGSLSALEHLNYYSNAITELPSTISLLTKLTFLDAAYNNLTIVRKELESLSSLKTLNLNNNRIQDVVAKMPTSVSLPLQYQTLEKSGLSFVGTDLKITDLPPVIKYSRSKNDFSERNNFRVYLRGGSIGVISLDSDGNLTIPGSALSSLKKGDELYISQENGSAYGTQIYLKDININLTPVPDEEYQALVDFYNSANGKNWYNAKWDISKNNLAEGSWSGVSLQDGHVVGLTLSNNNVRGSFPNTFKNLKYLKTLVINGYYNDLSNANLAVIGELANLEYIDFNNTSIKEAIPATWSNLVKLRKLYMFNNKLADVHPSIEKLILTDYDFKYQNISVESIAVGANAITYKLPLYMRMNINGGKITFDAKNQFSLYVNGNYISESFASEDGTITFNNISSLKIKTTDKIRIYQNTGVSQNSDINFNMVTFGTPIPDSEYQALVKLYESTGGTSWVNKWNTAENNLHLISWYGVGIKDGHVVSINLPSNNLKNEIPKEIANLTYLKVLNLQNNNLTGTLPESIGSITPLEVLDLNTNKLGGTLPASLASLQSLVKFSIANNNFEGEIPAFLADFPAIQHLDISSNAFNNIVKKLSYDFTKTYIDLRNQRIQDNRVLNIEGTSIKVRLSDISRYSLELNNFEAKNTFALLADNITHAQATANESGDLVFQNIKIADISSASKIAIRQLTGSFKDSHYYFAGIRDGSIVPVPQSEYEALVTMYKALNGEKWTNRWPVESNTLHTAEWYGVNIEGGHVVSIVLPNNNIAGFLPNVWGQLPSLQKLDVSGNSISNMDAELPKSIEFIADRQVIDMGQVDLSRDAVLRDTKFNQYSHAANSFSPQTYNLFIGDFSRSVSIPQQGLRLLDLQSTWKIAKNQPVELRQTSGSALNSVIKYQISYEEGDSNIDAAVNVLDVQNTLNYILQNPIQFFNYGAADLNSDSSINILDIVKLINSIQVTGSTRNESYVQNIASRRVTAANSEKVALQIENDKLLMDTKSYSVSSFEIILKNTTAAKVRETLSQLGYAVSIKDQAGQVSIIAYSLTSVLKGKIVLSEINPEATIGSAMLSDSNALEIPYEILSSGVLDVNDEKAPNTATAINYPNPFTDFTVFQFYSSSQGTAAIEIYDMSGRLAARNSFAVAKGNNRRVFHREDLPAGAYLYIIRTADNAQTFQGKLIIN